MDRRHVCCSRPVCSPSQSQCSSTLFLGLSRVPRSQLAAPQQQKSKELIFFFMFIHFIHAFDFDNKQVQITSRPARSHGSNQDNDHNVATTRCSATANRTASLCTHAIPRKGPNRKPETRNQKPEVELTLEDWRGARRASPCVNDGQWHRRCVLDGCTAYPLHCAEGVRAWVDLEGNLVDCR